MRHRAGRGPRPRGTAGDAPARFGLVAAQVPPRVAGPRRVRPSAARPCAGVGRATRRRGCGDGGGRGRSAHAVGSAWWPHRPPIPQSAPPRRAQAVGRRACAAPASPAAVGGGRAAVRQLPAAPVLVARAARARACSACSCYGRRARAAFGYGFLFGMGFLLPLLTWIGALVGPVPWVALVVLESLFVGLGGAGMALVSRLPAAPVWSAAVWVASEALRGARAVGRAAVGPRRLRPARRSAACTSRPSAASRCCRSSPCWPGSRSASWRAGRSSGGAQVGRRVARDPPVAGDATAADDGAGTAATVASDASPTAAAEPAARPASPGPRALVVPLVIGVAALAAGPLAALVPPLSGGPGHHGDDRRRAGQRPAPRPGLQRPAPRGARQPREGDRWSSPPTSPRASWPSPIS